MDEQGKPSFSLLQNYGGVTPPDLVFYAFDLLANRRRRLERDSGGVTGKFGVQPRSIPDYLALVGDAADGYPGLPGWGAKSAAAVLSRFGHLEAIPANSRDWHVNVSNPQSLSETLNKKRELAFLFRELATLRTDLPLFTDVNELLWQGSTPAFPAMAERLDKAKFAKTRVARSRTVEFS